MASTLVSSSHALKYQTRGKWMEVANTLPYYNMARTCAGQKRLQLLFEVTKASETVLKTLHFLSNLQMNTIS